MAILLSGTGYTDNTSYSTFTMDLVFGHHLADRRASQELRLFKYADRGFGLRVLPSYAKSLEEDNLQRRLRNTSADREGDCPFWQMNRKPEGAESGLKTLKRIAYLGQNYTQRFYFGAVPICIAPEWRSPDSGGWNELYDATKARNEEIETANDWRGKNSDPLEGPLIALSDLDSGKMHVGLPGGRRGIGGFELFIRHCEAWRLHARGEAT